MNFADCVLYNRGNKPIKTKRDGGDFTKNNGECKEKTKQKPSTIQRKIINRQDKLLACTRNAGPNRSGVERTQGTTSSSLSRSVLGSVRCLWGNFPTDHTSNDPVFPPSTSFERHAV